MVALPRMLVGRTDSSWLRLALSALIVCVAMLVAATQARATSLAPGDVVVYRVGNGGSLGSSAVPVFFDEYDGTGKLVESIALPTTTSAPNHRLTASGSGSSEGLLTLSANGEYLIATGYDAAVGTSKVAETANPGTARTLARVSASGEIDTTTALTDVSNENNARGATSNDGKEFWWSGAGKKTSGGVHYATLGATTSTLMSSTDTNARAVAIFGGQLYTSSDPTKEGINIATVGSGLPTTTGQTTSNLPFATAPTQPYAFSLVTLGVGPGADTMYVADNSAGAVVKFGLSEGKWVKQGSVAVTSVTGVTADDINGTVAIYATTSGASGEGGILYKITDSSGVGGTLSGSATQIATAPSGEAFRGVAFTPGTTFGSGGTPPPPAPTIVPDQTALPAAIGDPTNPTLGLKVSEEGVEASELTVTASSSNPAVAPSVEVGGSGATRTLTVTPGSTVGHSTITLTVKAPGGGEASTTVDYGLSANEGDETDRYYAGAGNGSTAIDVGGGYMVVADDEGNVLRLYQERNSGEPTKTFDFTKVLPVGTSEADIEASARVGNTLYWMGSLSNKKSGKLAPEHDIVFAATLSGSGASTELTYLGSYTHLREDMVAWDEANGNPLGLAASTANGLPSNEADGFNAEGLEFAAGSGEEAYVAFRAPLQPTNDRQDALLIPVSNFASLVTHGNPGSTKATFGAPLQWSLGGRGLREIRRNADGEFLAIAGTSDDSNSTFGLYAWDGNPADQPVLTETALSSVNEGAWEDIVSVPDPIANGSTVELLQDDGDSVWYADGLTSKTGMPAALQKDLGRIFTITLPAPPDRTPPTVEIDCPASVVVGQSANATVTASDGQSGLASDPSGTVPIDTSKAGSVTIERTATDNAGNSTTASCTTQVVHTQVITGTVKSKLVVKSGEAVELAPGAVAKAVEVQAGGALEINGATTKAIKSSGATVVRICGATVEGAVKIAGSSGQVVLGDGEGCAPSKFTHAVVLAQDTGGQRVIGEQIGGRLAVTGGDGGTTVTQNAIAKALVVTGNAGEVTDTPNTVGGRSKIQSRRARQP
jgi:hypothetical protein